MAQKDINFLVKGVRKLFDVESRWHSVTLKLELEQTIPSGYVDKIFIEQVIMNLARNVIDSNFIGE